MRIFRYLFIFLFVNFFVAMSVCQSDCCTLCMFLIRLHENEMRTFAIDDLVAWESISASLSLSCGRLSLDITHSPELLHYCSHSLQLLPE